METRSDYGIQPGSTFSIITCIVSTIFAIIVTIMMVIVVIIRTWVSPLAAA